MPRSVSQSLRTATRPAPADVPSGRPHVAPRQPPRTPRRDSADVCQVRCVNQQKVDLARAALPAPATLHGLTELLRALGDVTRLQIICALSAEGVGELCVCDLATLVGGVRLRGLALAAHAAPTRRRALSQGWQDRVLHY